MELAGEAEMKITRIDYLSFMVAAMVVMIAAVAWMMWEDSVERERRRSVWQAKIDQPATDWFSVSNISIPEFLEGQDPTIVYDRVVKLPFNGTWVADAIATESGANQSVCTGNGTIRDKAGKSLQVSGIKLSWLMGKDCRLNAGQYSIMINYEIKPLGYPPKFYSATSNIFRVLPEGSQLYLEPEQIEKLEQP
jgi:hypothetical protein